MGLTTADKVASYIICWMDEKGREISPLELQKLVYYVQAWYLAINKSSLFNDPFESWIHGPVQPELWRKYRGFGWKPIDEIPDCPEFPDDVKEHIEEVMDAYGKLDGFQLEKLVHSEEPWLNARGGISCDEPSNSIIAHKSMKEYYSRRID